MDKSQEYYLFLAGRTQGPFTPEQLSGMLRRQEINADTQCYQGLELVWRSLSEYEFFAQLKNDAFPQESAGSGLHCDSEDNLLCPHCWHHFTRSEIKFVSCHLELLGDPVLGETAQTRFLPMTYTPEGFGIDARGLVCHEMACPRCHLPIPESVLEAKADIVSIVGAPASGKSYFLTALSNRLRRLLPEYFGYTLYDSDAGMNTVLNQYEALLFGNSRQHELVALPKTELQGSNFSNQVTLTDMNVNLPLPFVFSMQHMHSQTASQRQAALPNLVLYDNAGEHFEPGRDRISNLASMHLLHSKTVLFCYDPLKESRAMQFCDPDDPQAGPLRNDVNQTALYYEMTNRIKKYGGSKGKQKNSQNLVFVITKFDAWKNSFPIDLGDSSYIYFSKSKLRFFLDLAVVKLVSFAARDWMLSVAPELVSSSESMFANVFYLPVSALGRAPQFNPKDNMLGISPSEVKPLWVEVPMLIHLWQNGLLPVVSTELRTDCPSLKQYQLSGKEMFVPDELSGRPKLIPALYWGEQVFDQSRREIIRLPNPKFPETETRQEEARLSDDEFWRT